MQSPQDQAALAQQLERNEGYLAVDPGNRPLLATVLDLCLAAGQHERAEAHARKALEATPEDPYLRARLGNILLADRQWEAAAALFEGLLAQYADAGLAYNLAYACLWLGRHEQGWTALAPHVADAGAGAEAVTLALRLLHHLGELDQAVALAATHLEHCREAPAFLGAASAVHLDAGDIGQADQLSAAALARGRTMEALVVGGSVALARTDSAAAAALLREALERNPEEGRAWSGLGLASLLQQDLSAALPQLEKAVRYLPGHIGTWHVLGWARIFSGDPAGAEAAFRTALDLDRNFGESHGGMAVVQALAGRREEAQASIDRALGLDKQSLSARYAQMALAGELADPVRFRALAMRVLAGRAAPFGGSLADVMQSHGAR
ncbi:tetratricopeptide repeat protein [Pseudoduganella namucuonensis]|uniref:Tfp pilus assembly protein PilF n=1 Tax=Pseudoduganella namucuonensis TaxID=1035707 RepID=A0A1I7M3W8_9BURK|nr:tetratricopeptide repeat protein [Pseudoduganella namucuonensis]SFV16624.1 Tfp pilus assembly protein PilF [Pseudoduganella namucuonensis]